MFGVAACEEVANIVFVLDIGNEINWRGVLEFSAGVVELSHADTRVGLVTFTRGAATSIFYLNTFTSKADILSALRSTVYGETSSSLADGIRMMNLEQFTSDRGDQSAVSNIAMVITDRESGSAVDTISAATAAKDRSIIIYSIAIGRDVNRDVTRYNNVIYFK